MRLKLSNIFIIQWYVLEKYLINMLCLLKNKIFHDEKYLIAAEQYSEVVWKRGLLTKGYGLCHGVSGNTYTFMSLYQLTGVS